MRRILNTMLLLASAFACSAFVSSNVPLGHWSYDAIDKLAGQELIDSAMMTTRPFSRLEMARLIAEAAEKADQLDEKNEIILAILDRLKKEFKAELIPMGVGDGEVFESFIKPVEDPYAKYVFADNKPDLENQRGDVFDKHRNYRLGFASRMKFFDRISFYLHPEYVDSSTDPDRDIELIEGYGKLTAGKLEFELGKDSLWWGPAYHGSMLMSNNAEPFKMLKISNPHPVPLPWIFRWLGPFKAVWFLTELEKDRLKSNEPNEPDEPKLMGLRINFKPHPAFEFGLSRAMMFGGSGRPSLGLRDYWHVFWATQENRPGKLDNNQLAGLDASILVGLGSKMPAKSIKLYMDLAAEDEADGLPSNWGKLFGMQLNDILHTGRTDLRIEYAHNRIPGKPNAFYSHAIYQSGYTYKGRIIGHHMGTDAHDLFVRLTHYLTKDLILGLECNREVDNLSARPHQTTDKLGVDLTSFISSNWQWRAGYRYENADNSRPDDKDDNHIFYLQFIYDF